MKLQQLLGIELPIVQAPMAGVQGRALAVAVSNADALSSLPCAMLGPDAMRKELAAIKAQTRKPFNVNFFCHAAPTPGRSARSIVNRIMQALGPISAAVPSFPLAAAAIAPLRARDESMVRAISRPSGRTSAHQQ